MKNKIIFLSSLLFLLSACSPKVKNEPVVSEPKKEVPGEAEFKPGAKPVVASPETPLTPETPVIPVTPQPTPITPEPGPPRPDWNLRWSKVDRERFDQEILKQAREQNKDVNSIEIFVGAVNNLSIYRKLGMFVIYDRYNKEVVYLPDQI